MPDILIIDDEEEMRLALRQYLEAIGYTVREAGNGQEALRRLNEKIPDLALLDLRLPEMDGMEILAAIRKRRSSVPVFILTGYGDEKTKRAVFAMGATRYFTKPFPVRELAAAVESSLRLKELKSGPSILDHKLAGQIEKSYPGPVSNPEIFEPMPRRPWISPPWRRRLKVWPAIILACAAFAWAVIPVKKKFTLEMKNPIALSWDGSVLWTADWITQEIQAYKLKGGRLIFREKMRATDIHITGLAAASPLLYLCDPWQKKILSLVVKPGILVVRRKPSPGENPSCLARDKESLWSCDGTSGVIYRHRLSDLDPEWSFPSQASSPAGLARSGRSLWIADSQSGRIYKYKLTPKPLLVKIIEAPPDESGLRISAFTAKGRYFWLTHEGSPDLIRRPIPLW